MTDLGGFVDLLAQLIVAQRRQLPVDHHVLEVVGLLSLTLALPSGLLALGAAVVSA